MFFQFPTMESVLIEINTFPDTRDKFIYTKYFLCDYCPGHPEGEYEIRYKSQVFQGDRDIHGHLLTNT